jgi:ParB-like chromosome segregation protein Spo0J
VSEIPFHPIANIFPLIEGQEFRELAEDVRAHGLRESIVLHDGMILDGRNRFRACQAAQVDARFTVYDGADPVAYVVSLNLRRRHLNESQRAMVAARIANLGEGRPAQNAGAPLLGETPSIAGVSQTAAGKMLNVSTASVERAATVRDHATPDLIEKVERGTVASVALTDRGRRDQPAQVTCAQAIGEVALAQPKVPATKT